MKNTVVVGLQWGDEGKGKIIDYICKNHDIIVRFQGGNNAGHTIVNENKVYKLSHIPSGILYQNKISVLGTGMVIELEGLFEEIKSLENEGVSINELNFRVADNASVVVPFYKEVDKLLEKLRGKNLIGTTSKGIGIAYQDRIARRGIRICDLYEEEVLVNLLNEIVIFYTPLFQLNGLGLPSVEDIKEYLKPLSDKLKLHVINSYDFFRKNSNCSILFEGAQGLMLDILWGTYPFVTSSQTHIPQLFTGSGIGFKELQNKIGVMKAYTTRVGAGPFPTEDFGEFGNKLQNEGKEFGTVTGRKRRCGALDLVALKFASTLSGISSLALTKLDVLDKFEEISVCVEYEINGRRVDYFPSSVLNQKDIKPIYKTFKGWQVDISKTKKIESLPQKAKDYIEYIEKFLGIPVEIVSVGADRTETIYKKNILDR